MWAQLQAPAKVGTQVITTAITVLEQKSGPQFIFGLDNLRRHLCCIDLKRQVGAHVIDCMLCLHSFSKNCICTVYIR